MIELTSAPIIAAAIGGLVLAALFAGIASDRRGLLMMLGTAAPVAVAIGFSQPFVQVSTTWVAASLGLNAALGLARGRLERAVLWAAGPALVLAIIGIALAFAPSQSTLVIGGLLTITIASIEAGWFLRHLRSRVWFNDVAMLGLLTALALMAAPALLLGWRRAGIAAEGQDPAPTIAPEMWPLVVCGIAFVFGLSWRMWMNNGGKR